MSGTIQSGSSRYGFNNNGQIFYENWIPSGEWVLLGAVRLNNFGKRVEYCPLKDFQSLNGQWKYKNGKQKWHVLDLDHGTKRTWMSPGHEIIANNP